MPVAVVALVACAGIMLAAMPGVLATEASVQDVDFFVILHSVQGFADGGSAYEPTGRFADLKPNLNHPALVVALSPLTRVTPATAFWVLTLLSVAALVALVVLVARETAPLPRRAQIAAAALAIMCPGVLYSLQLGQLGLLLALGVFVMWRYARAGRWTGAGWVFGALVVLKPFLFPLGLLFLRRPARPGIITTAAGALLISGAALPFVGVAEYGSWFATLAHADWFANPMNISITSLVDRVTPGALPGWAPFFVMAVVVAVAAAVTLRSGPADAARRDRDFSLLLLTALVASPLGWLYYVPMLLPVAVTLHSRWHELAPRARMAVMVAAAFLWVPYIVHSSLPQTAAAAAIAATYTYGLLILMAVLGVGTAGHRIDDPRTVSAPA